MQENELENAARIMVAISFGLQCTDKYLFDFDDFIDTQIDTVVSIWGSFSHWYSGRHLLQM